MRDRCHVAVPANLTFGNAAKVVIFFFSVKRVRWAPRQGSLVCARRGTLWKRAFSCQLIVPNGTPMTSFKGLSLNMNAQLVLCRDVRRAQRWLDKRNSLLLCLLRHRLRSPGDGIAKTLSSPNGLSCLERPFLCIALGMYAGSLTLPVGLRAAMVCRKRQGSAPQGPRRSSSRDRHGCVGPSRTRQRCVEAGNCARNGSRPENDGSEGLAHGSLCLHRVAEVQL